MHIHISKYTYIGGPKPFYLYVPRQVTPFATCWFSCMDVSLVTVLHVFSYMHISTWSCYYAPWKRVFWMHHIASLSRHTDKPKYTLSYTFESNITYWKEYQILYAVSRYSQACSHDVSGHSCTSHQGYDMFGVYECGDARKLRSHRHHILCAYLCNHACITKRKGMPHKLARVYIYIYIYIYISDMHMPNIWPQNGKCYACQIPARRRKVSSAVNSKGPPQTCPLSRPSVYHL